MSHSEKTRGRSRIKETLATLAKAWPVLAEHASHMDGAFNLAHTKAKRMFEALRAAVVARDDARKSHGTRLARRLEEAWESGYEAGCEHGSAAAHNDFARRDDARRRRIEVAERLARRMAHAD